MVWLYSAVIITLLVYYLLKRKYEYWKRRGIPGPTPHLLFGNFKEHVLGRCPAGEAVLDAYRNFERYPFVGIYRGISPCLLIRDPEFIKHITVVDFKHFYDNVAEINKKVDPVLGRNPFVLKGEEWKTSRAQLSPAFTSGKMKYAFPFFRAISEKMMKYLKEQLKRDPKIGLDAIDLCLRYTIDTVASCAFGEDGRCFDIEESEFIRLALGFSNPESTTGVMLSLAFTLPWVLSWFSVKIVPKETDNKLMAIISQTIQYRKQNNIKRNDFLQFLLQLKETTPNFTDLDATGHAASFFADGYETSAYVMQFVLFDLARNPECQKKVRKEIIEALEESGEKMLTYEIVQELKYLEASILESLRVHIQQPLFLKTCTKKYFYESKTEEYEKLSVTLNPGDVVVFNALAMHHDPKYFTNPEKYLPERMLDKNSINKYAFLPFGVGPRACVGQRFAMLQLKAGIANLLLEFSVSLNPKTKVPIKYTPRYFFNAPEGRILLDFKKIEPDLL